MISQIEKGEINPSVDILEKVSCIFCVPLNFIEENSIHNLDYSFPFETDKISLDDMNAISTVNRIVFNLENIN